MKRFLQTVAFAIVGFLAVPLFVVGALCLTAQSGHPMNAADCCAETDHPGTHYSSSALPSAHTQPCGKGCCTASPQKQPTPATSEKAKAGPVAAVHSGSAALDVPNIESEPPLAVPPDSTGPARHILLKTFRI